MRSRLSLKLCVTSALLVACSGDPTPLGTPIPATPTAVPTPTATATALPTDRPETPTLTPLPPNSRPSVDVGQVEIVETRVWIPATPHDEDGDLVDLTFLYTLDGGTIYQPCTRANGSDNYIQITPEETIRFLWDMGEDVSGDQDVVVRVVPTDRIQAGFPGDSEPFTVSGGTGGDGGGGDEDPPDLEQVGGYVDPQFEDESSVTVNLYTDEEDNNQAAEFLVVVVNVGSSSTSFIIGEEGAVPEPTPTPTATPGDGPRGGGGVGGGPIGDRWAAELGWDVVPGQEDAVASQELAPAEPRFADAAPAPLAAGAWDEAPQVSLSPYPQAWEPAARTLPNEVGVTQKEFRVLSSFSKGTYKTILGILAATGEGVNVFVDQDIPIDWDFNCDGAIVLADGDEYDRLGRNAYGFDTCDLEQVGTVFSDNVLRNLRGYFGDESDVDNNDAVTVLLTPVLNTLNQTNSDPSDDGQVREVLAYPEIDLIEYNPQANPGSNYQEILYLPAPDPAGFFNPVAGGGGEAAIDAFVTLTMSASLAKATQSLISYNQHVLVAEGSKEEDWLDAGLGLLAADLTGFGGRSYENLFSYLATPNLTSIVVSETDDAAAAPAYLLCRYLVDRFGAGILEEMMTSGETGAEGIVTAMQSFDGPTTINELLLDFATTILLQGYTLPSGEPLLDPDFVPPFANATTIPASGSETFPGAEGYQRGVNIRGDNYLRSRRGQELVTEGLFRFNGSDWAHYAPGTPYAGYVAGGYGFTAVRVGGLIEENSKLGLATNGTVATRVLRIFDIEEGKRTFITEQIFGARGTTPMRLDMRSDGWPSVALGEIDPSESIRLLDAGTQKSVPDTDLYAVDLSGWPADEVQLDIVANRKPASSGVPSLDQIFVAVAPRGDVPNAESIQGDWTCDGESTTVDYPNDYLEYLYYQTVLTDELEAPVLSERTAVTGGECDFDGDGVTDDLETKPRSLIDQISTWQDEANGGASAISDGGFYPYSDVFERFVNSDALDGDAAPYANSQLGINTRNAAEGEEAFLRVTLPAGSSEHKYIVVVGGPGSTGPYELTVGVTR